MNLENLINEFFRKDIGHYYFMKKYRCFMFSGIIYLIACSSLPLLVAMHLLWISIGVAVLIAITLGILLYIAINRVRYSLRKTMDKNIKITLKNFKSKRDKHNFDEVERLVIFLKENRLFIREELNYMLGYINKNYIKVDFYFFGVFGALFIPLWIAVISTSISAVSDTVAINGGVTSPLTMIIIYSIISFFYAIFAILGRKLFYEFRTIFINRKAYEYSVFYRILEKVVVQEGSV
jgi:ABC-type transport system involved in cytochrome bd biosynthesis fused ATPase/permease subunit